MHYIIGLLSVSDVVIIAAPWCVWFTPVGCSVLFYARIEVVCVLAWVKSPIIHTSCGLMLVLMFSV